MVEPAEDLHLAPDAALVPLDLLLRDDLERDLDSQAVFGMLLLLRLGGEGRARVRARRWRRLALAGWGRGLARGGSGPAEGDGGLAWGDVPCCTLRVGMIERGVKLNVGAQQRVQMRGWRSGTVGSGEHSGQTRASVGCRARATYHNLAEGALAKDLVNLIGLLLLERGGLRKQRFRYRQGHRAETFARRRAWRAGERIGGRAAVGLESGREGEKARERGRVLM